jgi:hypothetical protein
MTLWGKAYDHNEVGRIGGLLLFYHLSSAWNSLWRRAYLRANRYLGPNFSNSARTQSVIVGIPFHQPRSKYLPGKRAKDGGERHTFSHQTIHHSLYQFDFILNWKIDEIRIDKYSVWRSKICIMRQEQSIISLPLPRNLDWWGALRRWYLLPESLAQSYGGEREETYTCFLSSMILSFSAFLAAFSTFSFLSYQLCPLLKEAGSLQSRITWFDHSLYSGEFTCLLCFTLGRQLLSLTFIRSGHDHLSVPPGC